MVRQFDVALTHDLRSRQRPLVVFPAGTAARIVAASVTNGWRSADPRRQASAMVRPGSGVVKRRTRNCPRRFSTGSASDGRSVTAVPALTI